jgi:soluble lytic murein transglycosylase-like protein
MIGTVALAGLLSASSCDGISRRVLYGIVQNESTSDPLAIHDDTDGRSYYPRRWATAAAIVVALDGARHAFSVGLMQVENVNWPRFHVTGVEMLNPAVNVAVGCAIYRENLPALYAYNTGSPRYSRAGARYAAAVLGYTNEPDPVPAPVQVTPRRIAPRPRATPFAFGTLAHPIVFTSLAFGSVHRNGRMK